MFSEKYSWRKAMQNCPNVKTWDIETDYASTHIFCFIYWRFGSSRKSRQGLKVSLKQGLKVSLDKDWRYVQNGRRCNSSSMLRAFECNVSFIGRFLTLHAFLFLNSFIYTIGNMHFKQQKQQPQEPKQVYQQALDRIPSHKQTHWVLLANR